eukprot:TRINITY_DN23569_c0_g1_i1.p1 TRINITY_DN23569_c0_g1~~TRINITY_DN23569_c0_g1_i1.p1  ORF type:complete len:126 (-),score=9.90 TRINITY_DN23569_c0_g1_i1:307-684(-)
MLNEFIRNGTNSKNKTIKQKSWEFLLNALDRKQDENDGKIECNILDSIEKGLKQSLSNSDKLVQVGSFKILDFLASINERDRVDKLFRRLSASKQKQYNKSYPLSTPDWSPQPMDPIKARRRIIN